jgi:hypothetical protein
MGRVGCVGWVCGVVGCVGGVGMRLGGFMCDGCMG